MKKLMMMAVMFVASATAFAGDSDVKQSSRQRPMQKQSSSLRAPSISWPLPQRRQRLTTSSLTWLWQTSMPRMPL